MNAPQVEPAENPQELIGRYFEVMAKHYTAAYRLSMSPPDSVRVDATERLVKSSGKTPRRAVDAILAAFESWRANSELPSSRAA